VRYRELERLFPELDTRGIHTQVVTSAFRVIPAEWMRWKKLNIVVSIDGLPAEHDVRRKPATYDRILKNIEDARVTIHCTVTSQIAGRAGYLDQFLAFWTVRDQISRVWFSLFTPQRGASDAEMLSPLQRASVLADLRQLRRKYKKLEMPEALIRELERPPASPAECIFARTTETVSADLKSRITPCQFGGDPDCRQCGCVASMALAAVGHHPVLGALNAGHLFRASDRVGKVLNRMRRGLAQAAPPANFSSPFNILER
jgi:sulfatase maturation enzyme AslB (radical SAM superfamily)